jgi:predicted RNA-binding protein associated with RNAse of E/G family
VLPAFFELTGRRKVQITAAVGLHRTGFLARNVFLVPAGADLYDLVQLSHGGDSSCYRRVVGSQTRATITERKTRLDGSVAEYVCEPLVVEEGRRALVRYVTDRDRPIEGTDLVLRKGTVTIGHFWTDRPYNVYHWLDGNRTVALYVNVATDTTITTAAIDYRDLVVDVVIRPSGAIEILDEDELPPSIEPRYRLAIAKAIETCVTEGRRLSAEIERETRAVLRT